MGREQSSVTLCLSERFKVLASAVCVPVFEVSSVMKHMFRLLFICLDRPPHSLWSAEKLCFPVSSLSQALWHAFLHIGIAGGFWALSLKALHC